jgi:hypothetical protein
MLPRELIEEFVGCLAATGLHVLVAMADAFDGFLVILTLPVEVVRQDVVKSISGALSAPTRELLELRQGSSGSFGTSSRSTSHQSQVYSSRSLR